MARCEVCGRVYDPRAFQVILAAHRRSFDRIECAEAFRKLQARPAASPDLQRVEQMAAELFNIRAELEQERRRRAELEAERQALLERLERQGHQGLSEP